VGKDIVMPAIRRAVRSCALTLLSLGVVATGSLGVSLAATPAHAASDRSAVALNAGQYAKYQKKEDARRASAARRTTSRLGTAASIALAQRGDPYAYGAAGPNAFDCSGLMYFAFQRAFDRTIPRVANDQKRASKRVWHRSNLRPGDLVFKVDSGGYAYHVGIYAGHGYYWHAPHSGSWVKRDKMEHDRWRFGRLIKT
jgi:cell wall-associated NlpC family hydrolase